MKRIILATYIFFCTGGTYAQQRFSDVFKKADFGTIIYFSSGDSVMRRSDTVRATLLITRGHMQIAHEKPGYVVYGVKASKIISRTGVGTRILNADTSYIMAKDTIYLDDRKMVLKAPVKVWLFIKDQ